MTWETLIKGIALKVIVIFHSIPFICSKKQDMVYTDKDSRTGHTRHISALTSSSSSSHHLFRSTLTSSKKSNNGTVSSDGRRYSSMLASWRSNTQIREGWIRWAELIGWADPLTVVNGWSNMADPTSKYGGWFISLGGWSAPLHQLIWLMYYLHPSRWLIYIGMTNYHNGPQQPQRTTRGHIYRNLTPLWFALIVN